MMGAADTDRMDFDIMDFMSGAGDQMTEVAALAIWKESYV